ncbi:hypothetical protein E2C01_014113 [Portunus trituberculatus]|uniref:Uncharacterized protein n=1 Tax=Portunus trituberculatus TaxID=210409 RepID=A0A5B7DIX3_PORTR|nr:hypothetical protein [Portunus trituberculatus]
MVYVPGHLSARQEEEEEEVTYFIGRLTSGHVGGQAAGCRQPRSAATVFLLRPLACSTPTKWGVKGRVGRPPGQSGRGGGRSGEWWREIARSERQPHLWRAAASLVACRGGTLASDAALRFKLRLSGLCVKNGHVLCPGPVIKVPGHVAARPRRGGCHEAIEATLSMKTR